MMRITEDRQLLEPLHLATIAVQLDPRRLDNPDADMRYVLPDLLAERSGGIIKDDGFDYIGEAPLLIVFLSVSQVEPALACIVDVIENVRVLDNDLREASMVAVSGERGLECVYPAKSVGMLLSITN